MDLILANSIEFEFFSEIELSSFLIVYYRIYDCDDEDNKYEFYMFYSIN